MPKIPDYSAPETEASGPVGGTSPILEQVGAYGRGLEDFGRTTDAAVDFYEQKKGAAESADAYNAAATQRESMMDRIQTGMKNGTLDDDELDKIKSDYQDWQSKQADEYDTPAGRNAFTRYSSRQYGVILNSAIKARGAVVSEQAKQNLSDALSKDSNTVMSNPDPALFDQISDGQKELIQAQVDSGALSQKDADAATANMRKNLFTSAFVGHQQIDYENLKNAVIANGGKVDPNQLQFKSSEAWLSAGKDHEIIDPDTHVSMLGQIKSNQQAAMTAGMQALQQKKDLQDVQGEKFKVDFYSKFAPGYSGPAPDPQQLVKAAQAGLITSNEMRTGFQAIEQSQKEVQTTNPALRNDLMHRALLPDNDPKKIRDISEIAPYIGNGISSQDFSKIHQAIQLGNQANTQAESQFMKMARSTIGNDDPQQELKIMRLQDDVQDAKAAQVKAGKPVGDLFNPKSSDFLGSKLNTYISSPTDRLKMQADIATGRVPAVPVAVTVKPGNSVPPTLQAPAPMSPADKAKADMNKPYDWTSSISNAFGRLSAAASNTGTGYTPSTAGSTTRTAAPAANAAPDFSKMGKQDLLKLDRSKMTPEQLKAASQRYAQLNAGGAGG